MSDLFGENNSNIKWGLLIVGSIVLVIIIVVAISGSSDDDDHSNNPVFGDYWSGGEKMLTIRPHDSTQARLVFTETPKMPLLVNLQALLKGDVIALITINDDIQSVIDYTASTCSIRMGVLRATSDNKVEWSKRYQRINCDN